MEVVTILIIQNGTKSMNYPFPLYGFTNYLRNTKDKIYRLILKPIGIDYKIDITLPCFTGAINFFYWT